MNLFQKKKQFKKSAILLMFFNVILLTRRLLKEHRLVFRLVFSPSSLPPDFLRFLHFPGFLGSLVANSSAPENH